MHHRHVVSFSKREAYGVLRAWFHHSLLIVYTWLRIVHIVCADPLLAFLTCILCMLRILRPRVTMIAARQLTTDLSIQALPESGKICSHLHWSLVRSHQMREHESPPFSESRCIAHSQEILQTGG